MISGVSAVLAYMVSLVSAIFMAVITPSWLVWRLVLLVPLAGEVAFFCYAPYEKAPTDWAQVFGVVIGAVMGFVFGIILVGPTAIVFGGLGWMFVKAKILGLNLSDNVSIVIGTLAGAAVGCGAHILTYVALFHQWRGWLDSGPRLVLPACAAGGAVGGFLIGLYTTKQSLPISVTAYTRGAN